MLSVGGIVPPLADITRSLDAGERGSIVPVYRELIADLETPVSTFLKLRSGAYSFLLESVEGGERLARYSFVGSAPYDVLRVGDGPGCNARGDPLTHLQAAMSRHTLLRVPSVKLPSFDGGAVGYVAYDAVRHFEPRTGAAVGAQEDALGVPEAVFMLADELVVFDHVRHTIKAVAHVRVPGRTAGEDGAGAAGAYDAPALAAAYADAVQRVETLCRRLAAPLPVGQTTPHAATAVPTTPIKTAAPAPPADAEAAGGGAGATPPLPPPAVATSAAAAAASGSVAAAAAAEGFDWESSSNVGRAGYEGFVASLKGRIVEGDIIQAVPSQRISRALPDGVGAFDVYRQLRVVNPSPYMFYLELGADFQVRTPRVGGRGSEAGREDGGHAASV
jgi:anthranilate synthase component 1